MAGKQTKANCELCHTSCTRQTMTRHLAKCLPAHDTEAGAEGTKQGTLIQLLVESPGDKRYWLHVEMPATAKLGHLDQFLRNIWLECCGHLSAFRRIGQKRARPSPQEMMAMFAEDYRNPDEFDMNDRVGQVFKPDVKVRYDYDFGSTTTLEIKLAGVREGTIKRSVPVRLLARNDLPDIPCGDCGKAPAEFIDMENAYDEDGWLCAKCLRKADLNEEEMVLPVVNSPRAGVCGYTG